MDLRFHVVLFIASLITWDQAESCSTCRRRKTTEPEPYSYTGNLPLYDVVLTFDSNGPARVFQDKEEFINHFRLSNRRNPQEAAIKEGRRAIHYFYTKYGFDFSHVSDHDLLSSPTTNSDGVTLNPGVWDEGDQYRLYTGTIEDQSQVFNRRIYQAGWFISFNQDTQATGTFRETIPATAVLLFGSYVILPCGDDYSKHPCQNILNPYEPDSPLVIFFNTIDYVNIVTEPRKHMGINLKVYNERWGTGSAIGQAIELDRNSNVMDTRLVLNWPTN